MRLVFAGTPEPAVPSLRALQASGHQVTRVLTRRDAPRGRKRVLTPSEVAVTAHEFGLELIKADRLDQSVATELDLHCADLGVIVAYGALVPEPLLSQPRYGWINLHFSALPRWRGAAPVQHALIAGDQSTSVSVFQLVPRLDAGDLLGEEPYPIPSQTNAGELLRNLAPLGAKLLVRVVNQIDAGTAVRTPQNGEVTLAPKLTDQDGLLRFREPRERILARFRGVTPEPGAHFSVAETRVKVAEARAASDGVDTLAPGVLTLSAGEVLIGTGTDPIVLERVQPAGKRPMDAADWFRGLRATKAVAD